MDATEQIKARLPLEDIVSEVVMLKSAGQNRLKGLCPFHSEKTPSFHVVTDKGFYHCFGCGQSGDLFAFVQQTQNLEFRDALELLAQRAGVELPERSPQETRKRDLYDVNDLAQSYFSQQLADHLPAREYLTARGLTAETVSTWGLGYAPEGWTNLTAHARTKGIDLEQLERAGLARNKDGRTYDLFRNRVTIPIRDVFGRTVGFSARTLGDDQAKYVNTPETPIFHKGDLLFGLECAKATIKDTSAAILVEGQMDVIALHQAGFTATVGAQSATLTDAQIGALERLGVTQLFMAFDSDDAGQRATLAGCNAVARRFIVRVVKLPRKDPAETVQADPQLFRTALKQAISEPRYRVQQAFAKVDLTTPQGQKQVLDDLKDAMSDHNGILDPVAQEVRRVVSQRLGIPEAKLATFSRQRKPLTQSAVSGMMGNSKQVSPWELFALALTDEATLPEKLEHLLGMVGDDAEVQVFVKVCEAANYRVSDILAKYQDRDGAEVMFRYLAQPHTLLTNAFKRAVDRYFTTKLPSYDEAERTIREASIELAKPDLSDDDRVLQLSRIEAAHTTLMVHRAMRPN